MRIGARPAAAPRRLRRPAAAVIPEAAVPGGRRVRRRGGGAAVDLLQEKVEAPWTYLEKLWSPQRLCWKSFREEKK